MLREGCVHHCLGDCLGQVPHIERRPAPNNAHRYTIRMDVHTFGVIIHVSIACMCRTGVRDSVCLSLGRTSVRLPSQALRGRVRECGQAHAEGKEGCFGRWLVQKGERFQVQCSACEPALAPRPVTPRQTPLWRLDLPCWRLHSALFRDHGSGPLAVAG